jgi:hypothetical protein
VVAGTGADGKGLARDGLLSLALMGQQGYEARILKECAATGLPEGCVFSVPGYPGKTGGANRMASEKTRKGN